MAEMNTQHEQEMKSMLGLDQADPLPETVRDFYWRYKRMVDRVSAPNVDANHLALVIINSQVSEDEIRKVIDSRPKVELPVADEGPVYDDDLDQVDWRAVQVGKEVVLQDGKRGRFLKREASGRIHIEVDGDEAAYRKYEADEARLVG